MRGVLYEIFAIYRRWSENARRRANHELVKRPLIRLRHLLPQLKSAGGEGLSIGGIAENELLAQLHIVPSFATNRVPAIPLSMQKMRAKPQFQMWHRHSCLCRISPRLGSQTLRTRRLRQGHRQECLCPSVPRLPRQGWLSRQRGCIGRCGQSHDHGFAALFT